MIHHLRALLGSIAFGIRQFVGTVLSFVGLRALARFVVPALILAFAAAAVVSARDTATILGSRPDVQTTTLRDAATQESSEGNVWFEFDALLDATSFATEADLGTFFYLARDPGDPSIGMLVRSPLNDAFFRQRVLTARLVDDPATVQAGRDALGALPGGFNLDTTYVLDEVQTGGSADGAFVPSQLEPDQAGAEILVAGRVVAPATYAACAAESCQEPDAPWFYYLADPQGASAIVLRSPHPPTDIPARLQGLFLHDTFDLRPVLESSWFAAITADVPTERAFSAGSRPPITVPASWVPTILFAAVALVLLASLLAGYPVFGASTLPPPARTLATSDGIELEISGSVAREGKALALDGSPGVLERLSIPELALRMWRYGLLPRELSRQEAEARFAAEARDETDRLVLHERDQSALVTIGSDGAATRLEAGRLYRLGRSAPSLRLRQGITDAYLVARSTTDRDRAAAEILAEASEST
jgi:hypothetical protein